MIAGAYDAEKGGHVAFTDLQHKKLTALQLGVQSPHKTAESVGKLVLGFLISLITDLPAAEGDNELSKDIERLKIDVRTEPDVVKLRETIAATKKFTPNVCKKIVKPFVARMDGETLKLLIERCQTSRNYGAQYLFDGMVTAIAQRRSQQANPSLWNLPPSGTVGEDGVP